MLSRNVAKTATLRLPLAVTFRLHRAACGGTLVAALASSRAAAAPQHVAVAPAETVRHVRVEYVVPEGCPDEATFFERVVQRAPPGALVSRQDSAWTLHIEVAGTEPSRGRLVVRDPSGGATERRFEGASCHEVIGALALATALAFEAQKREAPPDGDAERPDPPVPALPASAERRAAAPSSVSTAFALGASANATAGSAPSVLLGAGIFGEIAWSRSASARLGFAYDAGPGSYVGGGNAQFSRMIGQLAGCSWLLRSGEAALAPCLQLDAGAVVGQASEIPNARNIVRPWLAVTPMLAARWAPRAVFVEVRAGAPLPLVRDRFFFEPGSTIYEVPAVGATASFAVGIPLR